MSIIAHIEDKRSKKAATVTDQGQLIVAPVSYSEPVSLTITASAAYYEFFGPLPKKKVVITDIVLYSDRNVGVEDANVIIYQATASGSILVTATDTFLSVDVPKNGSLALTGLNWISDGGVWIAGQASDTNVQATIAGYYLDD